MHSYPRMRRTQRLGRYHLTERIGSGGMAEIYRAFTFSDEGERRDIAIKKLLPAYHQDEQFVSMLTDEFKIVSTIQHRNIAEVYELSELAKGIFIAMEYVDGKDLRSTVQHGADRERSLRFDDTAYILAKALDGLHHAHRARDHNGMKLNVVHRDFSPSNILVAYSGHVKLCDFGVAKANVNRTRTKTGIIKGKVKYMSPEQAFGRRLDARSDVFSAGSVLYELCTGRPPFRAKSEVELILSVREAKPTPAQAVNRHLPTTLARIITKAMHRSRGARYQSAGEFRDALFDFIKQESPGYRRIRMSRYMKKLWSKEIDSELRLLEEYALDLQPDETVDYGRNLIADALGPDATYANFSAHPSFEDMAQNAEARELVVADTIKAPPVDTERTTRQILVDVDES